MMIRRTKIGAMAGHEEVALTYGKFDGMVRHDIGEEFLGWEPVGVAPEGHPRNKKTPMFNHHRGHSEAMWMRVGQATDPNAMWDAWWKYSRRVNWKLNDRAGKQMWRFTIWVTFFPRDFRDARQDKKVPKHDYGTRHYAESEPIYAFYTPADEPHGGEIRWRKSGEQLPTRNEHTPFSNPQPLGDVP